MESTATSVPSQQETLSIRLRNLAVGALFAVVLLLPKLLHVRRNERSWLAFRVLLGLAGASLVVLPLAFWNSWLAGIAGLAMFLAAVLAPPAKPENDVDDKARQLGVLVVVNGGKYWPGADPASPVRLFVGADKIWALNSRLRPLLIIPTSQICSLHTEQTPAGWILRIRWVDRTADFSYTGIFAEHLARVAESSIRSLIPSTLPVLPRSRAAGA
jgi:hypothetical protein